jgi:hypothetical protein
MGLVEGTRTDTRSQRGPRFCHGNGRGLPVVVRADNLTAWQFKELLSVLEISPAIETPGLLIQTLYDRPEGNEADAITALESILDNTTNDAQLQDAVLKAQPALRQLLSAPDPEIRRRATSLIQKIAVWEMVELAKQIASAAP